MFESVCFYEVACPDFLPFGHTLSWPRLYRLLQARYASYQQEVFIVALFGMDERLLHIKPLFYGGLRRAVVYPRELVKYALQYNAASMVIAHNHLSGIAEPSQADERLTKRLHALLRDLEIELKDHLIVTSRVVYSILQTRCVMS